MDLEVLKDYILDTVDDSWSDLEKIRYAYIIAGFNLRKHTEFYLTLENKTEERRISYKKIDKIYENKKSLSEWDKMICKSAALFLKDVYQEMGIPSYLVETKDTIKRKGLRNEIHHYFLCVNDGENNYFLTPAADYAYIQNGMATKHFASEIDYMVPGKGGKLEKVYNTDEEIPHKVLTDVELKKIDSKIGYTTKYSKRNDELKDKYIDEIIKDYKEMYLELLEMNTEFYNKIFPIDESKRIIKSFVEANEKDWYKLINVICYYVGNRIAQITGKEYKFDKTILSRENLNDWYNTVQGMYNPKDYNSKEVIYKNPSLLFNKTRGLCESVLKYHKKDVKIENIKQETIIYRASFNKKIKEIAKHFIDDKFLIEPNKREDYVSNVYLNHKFSTYFPYLFNANQEQTNFNDLSFSEQIEIVKHIVQLMFSDLPDKSLFKSEDTITRVKPIFKRINIFSVRERKTDNYGCYFAVTDSNSDTNNSSYWYKFDFRTNEFTKTSLANIALECSKNGDYEILSSRLRGTIEELESKGYKKR